MEDHRKERAPLSPPAALLRHHGEADGPEWLRVQTYLRPYPEVLRLRHALTV
ncbi:DUF1722 domain-containing protein [Nocardiopsis sp. CC223A]|uniref:DUF1722 domain-containing protein n=1 Tax=Nocardiopsis sp. CC223A TaxID=3044051 RepID=UPI00278C7FCA|nr:DUF1722 domain-containing protein [Nocardiopsis sp. CC223A]